MDRGSVARSAGMGGALTALLVATPYLNQLNSCCCCLVILGALFAAWSLRSDSEGSASTGRCGLAGAFSGLVGGLIGVPASAVIARLAFGRAGAEARLDKALEEARTVMEGMGQAMPPGSIEGMEGALRAQLGLDFGAWLVILTLFSAVFFSFFGLLGGLLGGIVFRRGKAGPRPLPPGLPPPTMPVAPEDTPFTPPPPAPWAGQASDDGPTEAGPMTGDELPRYTPDPPDPPQEPRGG